MSKLYRIDSNSLKTFYYFIDEESQVHIRATGGSLGKWKVIGQNLGFEGEAEIDGSEIPKDVKVRFLDAIFTARLH